MNNYDTIILDTNILRYSSGHSTYFKHEHSREILNFISSGVYRGIIPTIVLMEIYYGVAKKINEERAERFLNLIVSINNVDIVDIEEKHARFAGKIYYNYNYKLINGVLTLKNYEDRISAIDCLIISIGNYELNSVVCTYDSNMQNVVEVDVKPPSNILGIH